MHKNVIVGQSGGPTAVINSSLAGVFQSAKVRGVKHVYGMLNGVQGLFENRYVDLEENLSSALHIELLKRTPSSYLGSCRYKLPNPADDERPYIHIFDLLKKLNIGYMFYIGGNDSMDTINKLSVYADKIGSDIRMIGVPKTIDNDLYGTDHTPGYGSAAKYVAATIKEIVRDGLVYNQKNVTIVEVMGRNAGWLTGSSALARGEDNEGVDLICLPEVPFDKDHFISRVSELQKEKPALVIAVSEGIRLPDGRYVCDLADDPGMTDAFGHRPLSGAGRYLADMVAHVLKSKNRCVELSILQRCAGHMVSRVDISEAYQVGGAAVRAALEGITKQMVTLNRLGNDPYQVTTGLIPIFEVANKESLVPLDWIDADKLHVKKPFLDYARPLIQAELTPYYVEGLPQHIKL